MNKLFVFSHSPLNFPALELVLNQGNVTILVESIKTTNSLWSVLYTTIRNQCVDVSKRSDFLEG